ncbi:WD40 repeat domain-containing protein [Sphaerisporangium aureirubrum]|uniref:WD40 repeat domain-containing protein n=1 Tax=Sphaerisporangium aureirubrum TaxID=1544736 RepID=A0ABW1NCV3_9ACTN
MRVGGVRRAALVTVCLVAAGGVLRGSVGPPVWPAESAVCAERPATPVPRAFGGPVVLGEDGHTNVRAVAFGRLGGRPVAVSAGQEGTLRTWALPGLTPVGEPVEAGGPVRRIASGSVAPGVRLAVTGGPDDRTPAGGGPGDGAADGDGAGNGAGNGAGDGGVFAMAGGMEAWAEPENARDARLDGRDVRVVAGDELRVVDAASGRDVRPPVPLGEDNGVNALELITLNGRLTAVVNADGGDENEPGPDPLRFWDLESGREAGRIDGDFAIVRQARAGGRTVLLTVNRGTDYYDLADPPPLGSVSVWDPLTRKQIALMPGNPPAPGAQGGEDVGFFREAVTAVSLAVGEVDGRSVALTGGGDNTVRLWDVATATQLAATVPPGHTDEISGVAVTERAGRPVVVTGGWDGRVILWDPVTRRRIGDPPPARDGPVWTVTTGRVGGRPAVGTAGARVVSVQDLATGTTVRQIAAGDGGSRTAMLGDRLVLLDVAAGRARLWDPATGERIGVDVPVGDRVPAGLLTPAELDGRPVVVVNLRRRAEIWDVRAGRLLGTVSGVSASEGVAAVGRMRCTTAAITARGRTVYVWDLRTGKRLTRPLRGHTGTVVGILFGRLGDLPVAVTAAVGGDIRVWNLLDGKQIGDPLPAGNRLPRVALGPALGHTVLVAGGRDERVRMWDLSVPG